MIPLAAFPPMTWNRARIITNPGLAAFVWGVKVILSSFFSYAVYAVSLGAGGCGGGDCVCSNENADGVGVAAVSGGDVDVFGVMVVLGPKRSRMLSMAACREGADEAAAGVAEEVPKMSASRS